MYISEFAVGFVVGVIVGVISLLVVALKYGGGKRNAEKGVPEREEDRNQAD